MLYYEKQIDIHICIVFYIFVQDAPYSSIYETVAYTLLCIFGPARNTTGYEEMKLLELCLSGLE